MTNSLYINILMWVAKHFWRYMFLSIEYDIESTFWQNYIIQGLEKHNIVRLLNIF